MAAGAAAMTVAVPTGLNLRYVIGVVLVNAVLLAGLPLLIAATGMVWLAALVIPLVLVSIPHWALIHEGIHGHLHHDRATNDRLSRLLAVLFMAPFDTLKFGHLSHHALNARPTERPEVFDFDAVPRWRALIGYYLRLAVGLYAAEAAAGPLSLLPRRVQRPIVRRVFYDGAADAPGMADRAERQLLEPRRLRQLRLEALTILALLALSLWLWARLWPVLVLALGGRAFLISFMDNAPHYDGPLADPDQGYDMAAPAPVRLAVLNSNYHGVHHRYPNLPWTALPAAFAADGRRFSGTYLTTPWRQWRGPLPLARTAVDPTT